MELLILLVIAAAVAAGVGWTRKNFRSEIDRTKRIRRSNRDGMP
ncbi:MULTISPECIES: hypothetical protein [unclassified Arthrobacter]|nr:MULTISPECIES: hypothetical protein [unclassified Arthrobacter]MDK1316242.1 hypothetical protein [Arthrobacter sp. zg.Y20]MDK1326969.1 hypothetical protein [Arthrobacter sp. zg-Y1143]WIB05479.1 hypothetical protein QNO06_13205 [Arthrobacter sp. zg-Y20]